MNEKQQKEYLEQYKKDKEKGLPFFPDILFKDALIALVVFIVLVALAYLIGAPLEARANPADTNYTPRPEWYFLFLFQMLKYFPGQLEVIGVVLIPTIVIILLFLLPILDRSPDRVYSKRPWVIGATAVVLAGIILLSVLSVLEAPPPVEAAAGDQTALLYTQNCAPCHGATVNIQEGTNLRDVISQGKHVGMPAWSGDITSDQIDALEGFILSPGGSTLFVQNCGECHKIDDLVAGNPLDLKSAIEDGPDYAPHSGQEIPYWANGFTAEEKTSLLNFLVAPDGKRLFAVNCSSCHGSALAYSGSEESLREVISKGGRHLEMPGWKEKLSAEELDKLAEYVVDPASVPDGQALFEKYCQTCHGDRIPSADTVESARMIIESGGSHETMPVWGAVLTPEQLNALVAYTLESSKGTTEAGQAIFGQYCAACHGEFGEGGVNPTRAGDIIAPISTAEYLKTRDDISLTAIISQGQPNFGMSPFGLSNGGPLSDEDVDAIVSYIRSWEVNPPVKLPPDIKISTTNLDAKQVYADLCSQCHGSAGEGGIGPSFQAAEFQANRTDQEIFDTINLGHASTAMIAWGDLLSADQISGLVSQIRQFGPAQTPPEGSGDTGLDSNSVPSFASDIQPLFAESCTMCHGKSGGWDATNYTAVMESGDHAPVIIPGDPDASLLVEKLRGTQTFGEIMPPFSPWDEAKIDLVVRWIKAGAPDN